jgi:hypothetical protein
MHNGAKAKNRNPHGRGLLTLDYVQDKVKLTVGAKECYNRDTDDFKVIRGDDTSTIPPTIDFTGWPRKAIL